MSHKRWYVITFVLLSIITGVGSILGNIASNVLPETWRPYLWLAWPLFVVFLLASIGLTIWQHHIQQQNISKAQSNQLPEQELQLDATKQIDHLVVSDTPLLQSDLRSTQRVSTENDDFAYDVFISYSAKDRSWVRGELLSSLESRGLRVCIDFRDFVPGAPSVTEMERSVLTSRKTLLILTPEYLESMWAEFEQLMLQTLDPANRKLRLIPLLKAKCDLPLRIRYLTYINFTEPENQEVAWSRLLAALGESPMQGPVSRIVLDSQPHRLREDWGEAPDISFFYGRQEELGKLEKWIVTDHCRLVGILGIGGIGKTVLATKLAKQIQAQFDYIIWRSLLNAPAVEDVLGECILLLSDQQGRDLPESIDKRILRLIDYFRKHRCLLVLDNFEAILQAGDRVGHYRDGYKEYGHVIQQVGEMRHQSCLLLTGREKPKELALSEGEISSVRSLRIEGLSTVEGREILKDKGLFGADETWETLVDDCTGNPLILKLVSGVIREVFGGDIASFLQTGAVISDDVYVLLDQQFNRLSE